MPNLVSKLTFKHVRLKLGSKSLIIEEVVDLAFTTVTPDGEDWRQNLTWRLSTSDANSFSKMIVHMNDFL